MLHKTSQTVCHVKWKLRWKKLKKMIFYQLFFANTCSHRLSNDYYSFSALGLCGAIKIPSAESGTRRGAFPLSDKIQDRNLRPIDNSNDRIRRIIPHMTIIVPSSHRYNIPIGFDYKQPVIELS